MPASTKWPRECVKCGHIHTKPEDAKINARGVAYCTWCSDTAPPLVEMEEPRGTKLLDGLGESWAVSTLKPGLHGRPAFRHMPDEASAIAYAREHALHGPLARQGGRVYYVLEGESIVYRVLRGLRGQEKRPGGFAPEPRREFIVVQRAAEMLPGRPEDIHNIRWVWDHGLSVEIIDPELAKERARVVRPATKSTRYAPGWAFKPPPKVRSR